MFHERENWQKNLVGYLLQEIFRVTKFLEDRGASIGLQLTSEHYKRSPLIQSEIEIFCKVWLKLEERVLI